MQQKFEADLWWWNMKSCLGTKKRSCQLLFPVTTTTTTTKSRRSFNITGAIHIQIICVYIVYIYFFFQFQSIERGREQKEEKKIERLT